MTGSVEENSYGNFAQFSAFTVGALLNSARNAIIYSIDQYENSVVRVSRAAKVHHDNTWTACGVTNRCEGPKVHRIGVGPES